jgi:hypothetical protein
MGWVARLPVKVNARGEKAFLDKHTFVFSNQFSDRERLWYHGRYGRQESARRVYRPLYGGE